MKMLEFAICVTLKASLYNVARKLVNTSGLSILLHGVISLLDNKMSYDKKNIPRITVWHHCTSYTHDIY